ncbi:unnamed protein product [Orchesella dallaii]|uniref:Uncharacterized protein n=1 Tax=Orchesella dallaii TaxID=48710 RepID=A0ABP1RXV9_9HEXA
MKRNCKNLNPSEGTYCASQLEHNWLENKAVLKYSTKEISSHTDLSSLHLKGCPRVAFIIEGPNYVKMRSGAYLLDFKSEEQGIHQALIESVCHNCTVENAEWRGLPLLSIGIFPLFNMQYEAYTRGDILFSGKSNTMHFVTCYPTRKPGWFSLLGYITAFDLFTWLTLVGTCVLTGLVIKQAKDTKDWCQFGFVCKILLCQGARNTPYSQWIGGSWLMTGIILVFFYQADSIERLTAPLVENKLSDFNEMLKSQFRVFTPSIEFGLLPYVQLINTLKEKELAKVHPEIRHPLTIEEAIDRLNVSFFVELMHKCKKEAFVDISPGVEFMKRQLQAVGISKRQMSWSEKPYDYVYTKWDFQGIPYPSDWFLLRIRSLAQSGLVEMWEEWKTRVVSWNDKVEEARVVEEKSRPLSLQDNTAVVFYLHAALLLITLVTFITEMLPYAIVEIRIFGGIAITLIRSGASFCMNALNKKCGKEPLSKVQMSMNYQNI